MDRKLLILLSVVAAITVSNLYIAQPLLALIIRDFAGDSTSAGILVTLAQVGYGLGVLFLVPVGDLYDRKRLILGLLAAVALALFMAAGSLTLPMLMAACLLIGLFTIVPQIVVPYAASMAPDDRRASVMGTVQAGLLIGILLARTFSGGLSTLVGWRGVFVAAALLCGLVAGLIAVMLPAQTPIAKLTYAQSIASMPALLKNQPRLFRLSLVGALNFAVFTSFWTVLPFLLESRFALGPAVAGLFGIVGAAGALAASAAGRLSDRKGTRFTQGVSLIAVLASFAAFALGARSLAALIVAVLVMDAGVQATHIASQADVFQGSAEARSRINGVYMFMRFAGGAAGSSIGMWCWSHWGWTGFCASGAAYAVASVIVWKV